MYGLADHGVSKQAKCLSTLKVDANDTRLYGTYHMQSGTTF